MISIKNFCLCMIAFLAVSSCAPQQSDKPVVTVSILPQKFILDQIVGDKAEVKCLLAAGANPETYDPTVTNLMGLQNSMAYMRLGGIGFEDAIIQKIATSNPGLPVYNSTEGIKPIYGTHGEHCHHLDPHTWSSVKNMRIMAHNMAQAMIKADSKNEAYYRERELALDHKLDSLDKVYAKRLERVRGKEFLVWHPSLSYFARDYGLNQIVVGGAENKEASVKQLQQVVDSVRRKGKLVFFFQKDFDNIHASAINSDLKAKQIEISPMTYDWFEEMDKIVNSFF